MQDFQKLNMPGMNNVRLKNRIPLTLSLPLKWLKTVDLVKFVFSGHPLTNHSMKTKRRLKNASVNFRYYDFDNMSRKNEVFVFNYYNSKKGRDLFYIAKYYRLI